MGLTIHYTIEYKGSAKTLAEKLGEIRQKCLDLPFKEVGEVKTKKITQKMIDEWKNPDTTREERDKILNDLGVTAWQMVELGEWKEKENRSWKEVKPTTIVSLALWPGEECESCDLNFQRLRGKFVCRSFCKTQYATHFARCHLLVIQLLDILKAEGFTIADVYDEGEYYETRDIKVLAKNINESTAMIASVLGGLKAAAEGNGMTLEAPIEKCQNFMRVDES